MFNANKKRKNRKQKKYRNTFLFYFFLLEIADYYLLALRSRKFILVSEFSSALYELDALGF